MYTSLQVYPLLWWICYIVIAITVLPTGQGFEDRERQRAIMHLINQHLSDTQLDQQLQEAKGITVKEGSDDRVCSSFWNNVVC